MEHLDDKLVRRLVEGLASGEEASRARAHVLECAACRDRVEQAGGFLIRLTTFTQAPRSALPATEAPTRGTLSPTPANPASDSTRVERVTLKLPRMNPPPPPAPPAPASLPLGSTVGRYLILHPVGQGGMGVVYAAYDPELDRKIALKLLGVDQGPNDDGQARLLREAQAMARVSHPNVTAVYDAGTYGGDQVFLAMELIEGGKTLRDWLLEKRTWSEILEVMVAAGRGLAAAHAAGLVHRDFKPENVLVGQDGRVHVTDFGLARLVQEKIDSSAESPFPRTPTPAWKEEGPGAGAPPGRIGSPAGEPTPEPENDSGLRLGKQLTQAGVVVGTPTYMAPEQHLGKPPDTRSDQFSFCTTLYCALYEQRPFDPKKLAPAVRGESRIDPASLIRPPPKAPRVPTWVKRVLMRGLAIAPESRFASMEALLARLSIPRATARWRWVAGLVLVLAGAGAMVQREVAVRRGMLCSGAGQRLTGIWDAEIQHRIKSAFDATGQPYAPYTFRVIQSSLDGYARDWAAMHTEACLATRARGEQTETILTLRMTCLERRLKELQALTELLTKADTSTLEHAVEAMGGLPHISTCADVEALSAPVPPPEDAVARAEVARLTTHLAQVKMLGIAGKYKPALDEAEGLVEAARKIRYLPLLAEALSQQGRLLIRLGRARDAENVLVEAWSSADVAGDDDVRVRVAGDLISTVGSLQSRLPEALTWAELGEAALARLGRASESEAQLRQKQGAMLIDVGQYPQALQQLERALAIDVAANGANSVARPLILINLSQIYRAQGNIAQALRLQEEATAVSERLRGPDHPDSGLGHNNLADLYLLQGDLARADAHARKAAFVLEATLGPEHYLLGAVYDTLAGILARQRRFTEAAEFAHRSLRINRKALGPNHLVMAYTLEKLASVYLETNRAKDAVPLLEEGLRLNNPDPGLVANLRFHLARALIETGGDRKRARELATQALVEYRAQGRTDEVATAEGWLRSAAR